MHTNQASPDPSVEPSASNLRVCRHAALPGNPQAPSWRFCNRTTACDQALALSEHDTKILFATGITKAGSTGIPSWKRVLDTICILLSLPVWLPIVLLTALWVKIASPGPIFFRQERLGYRGRRFMILKFRTMKVNVETRTHERHLEQLISANVPMTKLDASG